MEKSLPLIAIIGVDGSGKSAVIEALCGELGGLVKGCEGLHQARGAARPAPTGVIANHALAPHPLPASMIKIVVRGLEWAWRYRRSYARKLANGHLILCDRFYFDDVLIDPLKYRYAGPAWLVRAVRAVVPRPKVYILLDAPEAVLLSRKQEVAPEEVSRLRKAYLALVQSRPNSYCVDAAAPLAQVVAQTRAIIVQYV